MIYLDSSAIFKLVRQEPESDALEAWLTTPVQAPHVSSALALVEVIRSARRVDATGERDARRVLATLALIPMTQDILDEAVTVGDPLLRTLDAIHVATALSVRLDLTAVVTYDRRLAAAATRAGLHTVSPLP